MKIYLMRHGKTEWNKIGKFQGQVDTPLAKEGILQAQKTAEGMKEIPFDCIFSSPLKRAYMTAQIIRGDREIPLIRDNRLKEMSFGIYEGRRLAGFNKPGRVRAMRFRNDPVRYRPPKHGETFEELIARTSGFIREEILPLEGKMDTILITAHGAAVRSIILALTGRELKDFWNTPFGKNCSTALFECENGQMKMIYENKIYY